MSRTCIMILSAVLLGMGAGHDLTGEVASVCGYAGLVGMAAYFALHLVAHRRHVDHVTAAVERVSDRIALNASGIADDVPELIEMRVDDPPTMEAGLSAAQIATAIRHQRERRRRNLRQARK